MTSASYFAHVRPLEAPLARLSLAKVFIWALAARRISARLAALPPLPPAAAPPLGNGIILRHSRIREHSRHSQTGASAADVLP